MLNFFCGIFGIFFLKNLQILNFKERNYLRNLNSVMRNLFYGICGIYLQFILLLLEKLNSQKNIRKKFRFLKFEICKNKFEKYSVFRLLGTANYLRRGIYRKRCNTLFHACTFHKPSSFKR